MANFLITGGAGFIGSHLTESLVRDGNTITILDDFNDYYSKEIKWNNLKAVKNSVEIIQGDIRDAVLVERVFAKGKFDSIIHLAARAGVRPSIINPKLYFTTNIDGTFNLLDACRYHEVPHFVFASSSSVYGVNKKVPFSEKDALERTISPYAATKLACEQICSNYSELFGIRSTCLRFFTVYGPRQRPDLAIAKFTKHILKGEPIPKYGNGSTARDYTYISDIIEGIRSAIDYNRTPYEIFNLGGSATTTLSEMIVILENALDRKAVIHQMEEQPGDVPRTYADVTKSQEMLNYHPKISIVEGIKKYVNYLTESQ